MAKRNITKDTAREMLIAEIITLKQKAAKPVSGRYIEMIKGFSLAQLVKERDSLEFNNGK